MSLMPKVALAVTLICLITNNGVISFAPNRPLPSMIAARPNLYNIDPFILSSRVTVVASSPANNEHDGGLDDQDISRVSTPTAQDEKNEYDAATLRNDFTKAALLAVGLFVSLNIVVYVLGTVASFVLGTTTNIAGAALHALGDELMRELANVATFFGYVAFAAFELIKAVVPFVGKGVLAAGKAAVPVVERATHAVSDAASPYVDEAAYYLSSALDSTIKTTADAVSDAVDLPTVLAPIKGATDTVSGVVDEAVMAPIRDVTDTVAIAVDSTVQDVTGAVTGTVDAVIVAPIREARDSVVGAVGSAVDLTIEGVVNTIKGATDEVGASIKEMMPF